MSENYPCELLKTPMEAAAWREGIRARGCNKPLVLTNGCFDAPLHPGHIAVLAFAARLGYVLVALDSDENVRRLKGKGRPIFPLADRMKILTAIRYVSAILPFDGPMCSVVQAIRPDIYVKGAEWRRNMEGAAYAGETACCPMQNKDEWSTSKIITRIRESK